MTPISVVIITFNEERNISRCIDSVKSIADDIVVVDSFSNDDTEKICREKSVRFIQNNFEGHIEQKNFAVTQAKFPHILSLDADEELSDELKSAILEIKNNWKLDGYYMNRLTNYCGKWIYHCGWYPDKKLRLWDSRKGKWKGTNPHDRYEMLAHSITGLLKGDLLHYSYYSIKDHIQQVNYFTDISAMALYEEGKKGNFIKILFSPIIKFLRDYFLKLGFLDGYYGLVICMISAHATFLKFVKLKTLAAGQKNL